LPLINALGSKFHPIIQKQNEGKKKEKESVGFWYCSEQVNVVSKLIWHAQQLLTLYILLTKANSYNHSGWIQTVLTPIYIHVKAIG